MLYLDKTDITEVNVINAVYVPSMLQVHSVQRVGKSKLDFYANSQYKKVGNLIKGVNYVFTNDDTPNSDETDTLAVNETSAILVPSIGDLAIIKYTFSKKKYLTYLGLIQEIVGEEFQVQFLKKAG